jgi:DNA-binding SARP family transcriptional activator
MTQLNIRLLGSPEVSAGQNPLSFRTRKTLALLVYLVVEGGTHSRESLIALFWPENPTPKASVSLRSTLSRLRQALRPVGEALITENGKVSFDFSCIADLDLAWLSAAALPGTHPDELGVILEIDRGEFLAGFSLPDTPEFDSWATLQRESVQRQVEFVYDRLTQQQLATQSIPEVIETAARWVARAPLSEAAYRRLMAAQALAGDRSAALKTYEQSRTMLHDEFGIEPSRKTAVLAENISQDRLPKRFGEGTARSESSRVMPPSSTRKKLLLPFEGRADEHGQLVSAFRQTNQGGPQILALVGEAGIGKTRLVDAFQEWVALEAPEAEIWSGRAFETGGRLPYQPVIEALRQRLEQENAPEDLLDDVWLAELSQLMPELRARYPDLPAPMTGDASFVRSRLFSAVAILGSALASRHPAVFILDDMQWADADTRDMVHYLTSRWAESSAPILLVLAIRRENFAAESPLRDWLTQMDRDAPLKRLLIDPLSGMAVQDLVTRLAGLEADEDATNAFGDWLWAETRGLPFYIEALLQMLVAEKILPIAEMEGRRGYDFAHALTLVESVRRVKVPQGVREAILSRLDQLSEGEMDILLAAAVLGRECSFERLCQVADVDEQQALEAVEVLIDSRLLTEKRAARQPYTPAHDYIREVVYSESREARRRVFHRRALIALEADRAPAAECAFHALASMLDEPAFRFSLIAGDEALQTNAFQESLAHYDRAMGILQRASEGAADIEPQSVRRLYQNRGRAFELTENHSAAQENYQEMLELAAEKKDQKLELAALLAQCTIHAMHTSIFNPSIAKEKGEAALELAQELNDQAAEATALGGLMFATMFGGEDNQITLSYGEASLSLSRELGLKEQLGSVLIHLCWPYIAQKQLGAAMETNHEAEAVWSKLGNLPKLVETYEVRQFLYSFADELAKQLATSSELLRLSRSTGNQMSQGNALANMGGVHRLQGRFAEALAETREALAIIKLSKFPILKQSECYFWIDLYLAARVMDQAEHWADRLYEMRDSFPPMFQPAYLDRIARVKIAVGKLDDGKAILDRALELCSPDNVWSHYIVWIAITDAYLQLAQGNTKRAFKRLDERVQSYRQAGFRFNLAEEYWLRGKAYLALGEVEKAKKILLEAKAVAEEKEERLFLWQILATLSKIERMSGDKVEAARLLDQAREIINYIADRAGDEEGLRAAFLAHPEVEQVALD